MSTKKKASAPAAPQGKASVNRVTPEFILNNYEARKQDWQKLIKTETGETPTNHSYIDLLTFNLLDGKLKDSDFN